MEMKLKEAQLYENENGLRIDIDPSLLPEKIDSNRPAEYKQLIEQAIKDVKPLPKGGLTIDYRESFGSGGSMRTSIIYVSPGVHVLYE